MSGLGEGAHGVVKRPPEDLGVEVDGVAALIPLGPAPIAFLDNESGEIGHAAIATALLNHEVAAIFEQPGEIDFPGITDLFAGPRRLRLWRTGWFGFRRHRVPSSNAVE